MNGSDKGRILNRSRDTRHRRMYLHAVSRLPDYGLERDVRLRMLLVWSLPAFCGMWIMLLSMSIILRARQRPPEHNEFIEARIINLPPTPVPGLGSPAKPAAPPSAPVKHKTMPVHRPPIRSRKMELPSVPVSPSGIATPAPEPAAPPGPPGVGTAPPSAQGPEGEGGAAVGSDNEGAHAVYAPTPEIPDDLREEVIHEVAVAHFKVNSEGGVTVSLVKKTPNPRLNQILIATLQQWKFFPAMKDGVAIDSEFDLTIPITVQ